MGIREITHQLNPIAPLSLMERERVEERGREREGAAEGGESLACITYRRWRRIGHTGGRERQREEERELHSPAPGELSGD
jgi:hypothetical protein